jgi:hypothetical protein
VEDVLHHEGWTEVEVKLFNNAKEGKNFLENWKIDFISPVLKRKDIR